jgi:integrase
VRSKSRTERVVDLHEAGTLEAVSAYVMHERPHDTMSPILFLVGGNGPRRHEALSYAALLRLFARASDRAGIRTPWVTPHALRHSHATRMWEAGMRELTLQRWLGHNGPPALSDPTHRPLSPNHKNAKGFRRARKAPLISRLAHSLLASPEWVSLAERPVPAHLAIQCVNLGELECQTQDTCFRGPRCASARPAALPVRGWPTN